MLIWLMQLRGFAVHKCNRHDNNDSARRKIRFKSPNSKSFLQIFIHDYALSCTSFHHQKLRRWATWSSLRRPMCETRCRKVWILKREKCENCNNMCHCLSFPFQAVCKQLVHFFRVKENGNCSWFFSPSKRCVMDWITTRHLFPQLSFI